MKIAILSDSPMFPTGYSNQARLLCDYLTKKGHEIHYFASGYQGGDMQSVKMADGQEFNYKIYGQAKQAYFGDLINPLLKQIKPDFFIILLDTFMLHGGGATPWWNQIDTSPAQTAFWFPSDGGNGLPSRCDQVIRKIDYPVAMSKFGQKQVLDYHGIKAGYIPHGIKPTDFYRLDEKKRIELKYMYGLNNKFVIGTVMRNQGRKMPDKFIKTFASLAEKMKGSNKDWIVLMHTDFDDLSAVVDLRELIQRYNLENRIINTGMSGNALKGFPQNKMNEIYNLFDCFYLSTSGEGFGIPIIEAMACQIPVVCTCYTTTEELVVFNQAGFGANLTGCNSHGFFEMNAKDYDRKVINGTNTGSWAVERGLVDVNDAADKIMQIMNNPQLAQQMGTNGKIATDRDYDFEKVGAQWEKLIIDAVSRVKK